MHTRRLPIIKPWLPAIGISESRNSQGKSSKRSRDEAENEIKAAFDAHECKEMTAVRIPSELCAATRKRHSRSLLRVWTGGEGRSPVIVSLVTTL